MNTPRRTALTQTVVLLAFGLLLTIALILVVRAAHARGIERILRAEAGLTANHPALLSAWQAGPDALSAQLALWANSIDGTLTAFTPEGAPLASSNPVQATARTDQAAAPPMPAEIREALQRGYGRDIRREGPENRQMLFIALPVGSTADDSTSEAVGLLQWSLPLDNVNAELQQLQRQIALIMLAGTLLLAATNLWFRKQRWATIQRITIMVELALQKKFDGHVLDAGNSELDRLTDAANRLVDLYRKTSKRRARDKDRLMTVLKQIPGGGLMLNQAGRVRFINAPAAELLRTTPDNAIRRSFVQVVWDHRIAEVWQRAAASGSLETESIELGPDRFLRVTVTPFAGGDSPGYLVLMDDLTPLRRLEKMRRDFVSNVSHELRTPLASMGALVDTLRDGALEDPPTARRFLDRMDIEVDKMTQMVQELLELSRIESGQLPLKLVPTTVSNIVQPAIDRLLTQAERAAITLSVSLAESLPPVVADVERVQQVMINLVHNAIKFTPKGGSVTVTAFRTTGDPGSVTICVQDTGIGIPAADQPRIFERFYKTDRSRSSGGTGLGLAIAKHTVQAHGGRIWLESRENQGSNFFFTLPIREQRSSLPRPDAGAAQSSAAGAAPPA